MRKAKQQPDQGSQDVMFRQIVVGRFVGEGAGELGDSHLSGATDEDQIADVIGAAARTRPGQSVRACRTVREIAPEGRSRQNR
jgi:hypothetical protein